ncbi:amidohydrolase [Pseudomonas sp. 5Ae-yellow]|uniref:amidohydrolase n=1 Tax=Pseudomonas sp. 5Ae-yellow TaxID=2759848 RepID=UPI001C7134C6|nr:amidohydrolase [Pseudomonas sp. 5Ae-yellow]|tara:strand:+ start:7657 stop:9402 length:1746 start_codon:yes stop_codon:yes gene_type:complete
MTVIPRGFHLPIAALMGTLALPGAAQAAVTNPADALFFGGPVLTMDDAQPNVEAVAVDDGIIVGVGSRAELEADFLGPETQLHDLQGRTLIPGFVDAHSHFSFVGIQAIAANLLPPPDGPGSSIAELQTALREYLDSSSRAQDYGILIGFNYDDSQLQEQRHPTRQELDAVSTSLPIMAIHQSGHLGVYNSKALEVLGINADTANPEGGTIYREKDGVTPNGLLAENAHIGALLKLIPKFTPQQSIDMLTQAQDIYLANGFTTIQDGRTSPDTLQGLAQAAKAGYFKVDVVAYPDLVSNLQNPMLEGPLMSRDYADHFRIGGVKLTFDGSPQGKTAWFTHPYFQPPEHEDANYSGHPLFADEAEARRIMKQAYDHDWQVLVHANGDAAIDQLIRLTDAVQQDIPDTRDPRTVLIHGQYLRADQIPELVRLGIFPSLYPMHTFYWGDWHSSSVAGPELAKFISPTGTLYRAGIKFSIHSDAPVTFPNAMRILHSATNRVTRSGVILGPEERLDALTTLKAMTIWPAYQHFEENSKGSIEKGKVADLVVLSQNPITLPREQLLELKVMETIKDGESVYRADAL